MKIVVGLGNPGLKYRNTRHNAGFLALKLLAKQHGLTIKRKGFQGIYGTGRVYGEEVMLFEPLTYMNLSGEAVNAVCAAKLEEDKDLLVISDDFNIPFGCIRLRAKGSSGGHNGLQSISDRIGPVFARLRIGIGNGQDPVGDMSGYVLSPFSRSEKTALTDTLEKAVRCIEIWIEKGTEEAMKLCNEKVKGVDEE